MLKFPCYWIVTRSPWRGRLYHLLSSQVLVEVASALLKTCRATDIPARWGGEEFLIICPNTTPADALALAHRLRCCVELSRVVKLPWCLTASVGVSQPSSVEESYEVVIRRADAALYMAKDRGRNRVVQLLAANAA